MPKKKLRAKRTPKTIKVLVEIEMSQNKFKDLAAEGRELPCSKEDKALYRIATKAKDTFYSYNTKLVSYINPKNNRAYLENDLATLDERIDDLLNNPAYLDEDGY